MNTVILEKERTKTKAQNNFFTHFLTVDAICEFITIGPVQQSNLKRSKYWMKIEDDVKYLCNLGNGVQIYSIGNSPLSMALALDIGNNTNLFKNSILRI